MTEEEYNKAPKLDQILYDCTGMLVENHTDIAEAMQKYADEQLNILLVSKQRELLIAFAETITYQKYESITYNASSVVDNFLKLWDNK